MFTLLNILQGSFSQEQIKRLILILNILREDDRFNCDEHKREIIWKKEYLPKEINVKALISLRD